MCVCLLTSLGNFVLMDSDSASGFNSLKPLPTEKLSISNRIFVMSCRLKSVCFVERESKAMPVRKGKQEDAWQGKGRDDKAWCRHGSARSGLP